MITVRPYKKSDFRYVQDVCLQNSWLKNKPTATNRAIVCALYCDYYLENEPQNCFVAVNEDDIPVGYILCATDLDKYRDELTDNYLPMVRKLSGTDYYRFAAEMKLEQRYIKTGYTAHLHLDVTNASPTADGENDKTDEGDAADESKEVTVALLQTMLARLKDGFIEGTYIVCGTKDRKTRDIFESNGFEDIDYFGDSVVYAKKLYSEDEE